MHECLGKLKTLKGSNYSEIRVFTNTIEFWEVKGELPQILTRTANHSLAKNTWWSYTSCLRSIEKMEVSSA